MKTTQEAVDALIARGIMCDLRTVQRWCADGRFLGAWKSRPDNRGDWYIPEAALETFRPPTLIDLLRPTVEAPTQTEIPDMYAVAYRQPWATAYFKAVRDFAPDPYNAAGISEEKVLLEVQTNLPFAKHQETLWQRRFDLVYERNGTYLEPRPILTWPMIKKALRGDKQGNSYKRIVPRERAIFDRAAERGYLYSDQCSLDLKKLWWSYCELMGIPFIYQQRYTRWYTHLEINLWPVWEGDGRPRLFTEPMSIEVNEVFVGQLQRRRDWTPDSQPSLNLRSRTEPYLPYTSDNLCGELLAIYRRCYPDNPPPNPESDPQWDGAARLVSWKVPERMTSRWVSKVQSGEIQVTKLDKSLVTALRQVDNKRHHESEQQARTRGWTASDLPVWEDGYCYALRQAAQLPPDILIRRYGITRFELQFPLSFTNHNSLDQLPGARILSSHQYDDGWSDLVLEWSLKRSLLDPLRTVHGINTAIQAGRRVGYRLNKRELDVRPIHAARWCHYYYKQRPTVLQVQPSGTMAWVTPFAIVWMDE